MNRSAERRVTCLNRSKSISCRQLDARPKKWSKEDMEERRDESALPRFHLMSQEMTQKNVW